MTCAAGWGAAQHARAATQQAPTDCSTEVGLRQVHRLSVQRMGPRHAGVRDMYTAVKQASVWQRSSMVANSCTPCPHLSVFIQESQTSQRGCARRRRQAALAVAVVARVLGGAAVVACGRRRGLGGYCTRRHSQGTPLWPAARRQGCTVRQELPIHLQGPAQRRAAAAAHLVWARRHGVPRACIAQAPVCCIDAVVGGASDKRGAP